MAESSRVNDSEHVESCSPLSVDCRLFAAEWQGELYGDFADGGIGGFPLVIPITRTELGVTGNGLPEDGILIGGVCRGGLPILRGDEFFDVAS